MTQIPNCISLIGMPGSGKSTVGVLLAKATGRGFVDTDLLVQTAEGLTLQALVDGQGHLALRDAEERVLSGLECHGEVISTGGSAVYSERGMRHLKNLGPVVFLDITLETVRERIGDFSLRGLAKRPDQTLEDLYRERLSLYRRHADITINADGLSQDKVCEVIQIALGE